MKINRENLLTKLKEEKRVAFEYRKRRHDGWNDNYLLERLKVETNRLTQRQEVCVPLMKGTIKSIMSRIGERPEMIFEDKEANTDREIIIKEKWNDDFNTNVMVLLDKIDKKQELICGRSYKKLNWQGGKFVAEIKDIFDVLIDPKTKTTDIESARYIIETGIYRTVEEIMADTKYDPEGLREFQNMIDELKGNESKGEQPNNITPTNLTEQSQDNIVARNKRMETLGAENLEESIAGADMIIELNQHFTLMWDGNKWIRYVCVVANEKVILSIKTLKEALGVDFWPFETWADDLDVNDFYSDGVGDILRVPNQMINVWYSQYMENRTLRNYGMNFFDDTAGGDDGWEPPEFEPRPGGWYPLPGKPSEVYQRVDIPDLSGAKDDIQFLINIAEKETASSDVEKGAVSDARRTLGEIQIAVSKSQERMTSMAPFYNLSWERFAMKWYLLTIANIGKSGTELYKKNYQGILIPKKVKKEDIHSEKGYKITAESKSQKSIEQIDKLNRLFAIKNEFPNNSKLIKAIQKRALKVADLNLEEIQEITAEEEKIANRAEQMGGQTPTETPTKQVSVPAQKTSQLTPAI